jgi:2-phosphosulfolactate phosphatase
MIDLFFTPAGIPEDLDRNRPVLILDIFRASTTITAALAAGAREVLIAGSRAEASHMKSRLDGKVLLAGERDGLKIEGYDLGNSPLEMTPEKVSGRTVIFDSTNGTKLARQFDAFEQVAFGSLVSLSATIAFAAKSKDDPIIACAGRLGTFSGEDALAAGLLISRLPKSGTGLNDAALFALRLVEQTGNQWRDWAADSFHGRYLQSIGCAADVDFCLTIDRYDFMPVKHEEAFIRG